MPSKWARSQHWSLEAFPALGQEPWIFSLNQLSSFTFALGKAYISGMIIFITVGACFSKHSVLFGFMLQTTILRVKCCAALYNFLSLWLYFFGLLVILCNNFHCGTVAAMPALAWTAVIAIKCAVRWSVIWRASKEWEQYFLASATWPWSRVQRSALLVIFNGVSDCYFCPHKWAVNSTLDVLMNSSRCPPGLCIEKFSFSCKFSLWVVKKSTLGADKRAVALVDCQPLCV